MTCPTNTHVILVGNDNPVEWDGVQNADGEYVNDADVTAELLDSDGVSLSPAVTLTLDYITDSNGRYRGTIQSSVALVADTEYILLITATVSGDNQTRIEVPYIAMTRTQ